VKIHDVVLAWSPRWQYESLRLPHWVLQHYYRPRALLCKKQSPLGYACDYRCSCKQSVMEGGIAGLIVCSSPQLAGVVPSQSQLKAPISVSIASIPLRYCWWIACDYSGQIDPRKETPNSCGRSPIQAPLPRIIGICSIVSGRD
jgi:hypothetical protein